jgi:hypothetical protein
MIWTASSTARDVEASAHRGQLFEACFGSPPPPATGAAFENALELGARMITVLPLVAVREELRWG